VKTKGERDNPISFTYSATDPKVSARLSENCLPESFYGPVVTGETLSQIAYRYQKSGVELQDIVDAIFKANPTAFIGDDVDKRKEGEILKISGPPWV
jgi:Tfp pilus assembly protein FimV